MSYINPSAIIAPNMNNVYIHPSYPQYGIDESGNIFSFNNNNRLLKPELTSKGYLRVGIRDARGQRKNVRVHRLVGWIFVELPEEFNGNYDIATINHKDHNKTNNHYTNLAWVTREYNTQEAWDNGYCDNQKEPCFLIDSLDNSYTPFDSYAAIDKKLNLPIGTTRQAIYRNHGLIRGRYIAGAINDFRWKKILANCTVKQIVTSYAKKIERYKQRGPRKITNLETGESKKYSSLSEFAREKGILPTSVSNYLKTHSDLYHVELV